MYIYICNMAFKDVLSKPRTSEASEAVLSALRLAARRGEGARERPSCGFSLGDLLMIVGRMVPSSKT